MPITLPVDLFKLVILSYIGIMELTLTEKRELASSAMKQQEEVLVFTYHEPSMSAEWAYCSCWPQAVFSYVSKTTALRSFQS